MSVELPSLLGRLAERFGARSRGRNECEGTGTGGVTRWLSLGQPIGKRHVAVMIRTTYETGPDEPGREDEIEKGALSSRGLELLGEEPYSEHFGGRARLCLSALPDDAEDQLMEHFVAVDEEAIQSNRETADRGARAVIKDAIEEVEGLQKTLAGGEIIDPSDLGAVRETLERALQEVDSNGV